jgi:hypothetical protein
MGLDMYFSTRHATSKRVDRKTGEEVTLDWGLPNASDVYEGSKTITTMIDTECGYFRKFNALHVYLVNHFGDDEDNCQPIYIAKSGVEQILANLKEIQEDHAKAQSIMPTQSGFFFGSTDYDEWYFAYIDEAITMFTDVLAVLEDEDDCLVYQASW